MRLGDQVHALAEENTRLRVALAAEQDKYRKWEGALNRAEATIIARETRYYQTQVEAARHTAMRLAEAGRIASMWTRHTHRRRTRRSTRGEQAMICVGDFDSLPATIKARRKQLGWTRSELAAAARLPIPLIIYIENGHEDVSLNAIRCCLYALNLYVGWEVTAGPRWRVDSHVSEITPGVNTRIWTASEHLPTGVVSQSHLFRSWREAYNFADTQARRGN